MPDRTEGGGEEAGFRVTDRRRVDREGPTDPSEGAGATGVGESRSPGQPETEAPPTDVRSLPVPDLLRIFIAELGARAWVHMGFIVDPATKQLAKDLPQARLAIDCIGSLLEHLGPLAERAERDELERMLADLRVNFVRQSGPEKT